MPEITKEAVESKLSKGEKLTAEETQFVMSSPPDGHEASSTETLSDEEMGFGKEEEQAADKDKEKATSGIEDEAAKSGDEKQDKETGDAAKKPEDEAKPETGKDDAPKEEEKKPEETKESFFSKVEHELEKPEGQEDLAGFTDREKGLYYSMKRERRRAQKAEEDRDAVRFERIKEQKLKDEQAKKDAEEDPGEDETAFLTKADLKKKLKEEREAQAAENMARERKLRLQVADLAAKDIVAAKIIKGEELPDYSETMKIAEMIIETRPEYQETIQKAYYEGLNPALVAYDLARKDPRFNTLYKPGVKKEAPKADPKPADNKAKETIKKIEENEKKPKTSGTHGGGDGAETGKEYTIETLTNMSSSEFRKVPKAIREKFLRGDL